jgi:hypothetical protein
MDSGKRATAAQARIISFSSSISLVHRAGSPRTQVDRTQQPARKACAIRKDYLHCVLSLERAMILCTKCSAETLARTARFKRNRTRIRIVNSRIAPRNAQAPVGLHAFVRPCSQMTSGLPKGQTLAHRESEDPPAPGDSRA